ncbi:NACHT domain-containing protein [Actinoplanes sp. CA-030573]|uniref:NACHT domain-containing protein n=1 Tax=Actinoplanes sp. CA-030573 TaxID=3239898 RepID=UPI003D9332BC
MKVPDNLAERPFHSPHRTSSLEAVAHSGSPGGSQFDSRGEPHPDISVAGSRSVQIGDHNFMVNIYHGMVDWLRGDLSSETAAAEVARQLEQSADAEWDALTEWGYMQVPWVELSSPKGLRTDDDLARHIAEGGHLIIEGEAQSGKTTLAVRLIKLLAEQGEARAVIFRLHSWEPGQRLRPWMAQVLRDDYGLSGKAYNSAVRQLWDRRIIPIFDGFDELQVVANPRTVQELRMFTHGRPAVITGIRPRTGSWDLENVLSDAAVIALQGVADDEIRHYMLQRPPPTSALRAEWEQVVDAAASESAAPVRVALSSPLNAWLAKTVLRAGNPMSTLSRLNTMETPAQVEEYLLRDVVRAVIERHAAQGETLNPPSREFDTGRAQRWLGFLAHRSAGRAIAFWHLRDYAPLLWIALVAVIALGASAGFLGWLGVMPPAPPVLFLLAGVMFGFGFARGYSIGRWKGPDDAARLGYIIAEQDPAKPALLRPSIVKDGALREHGRKLLWGLALVAAGYVTATTVYWILRGSIDWLIGYSLDQFVAAAVASTVIARVVAHVAGRSAAFILSRSRRLDASRGARTSHPLKVIHNDAKSGILMVTVSLVVLGLGYVLFWRFFDPPSGLAGLFSVLVGVLAAEFFWNQWAPYKAAHLWLVYRGRLPLWLEDFLRACHRTNLLRQNGNHFVFRHQSLKSSLAREYRRQAGRAG